MKLTIFDYNQQAALSYNLDINDLLLLKWFVDMKATGDLKQLIVDDHPYYLIQEEQILTDLPIIVLNNSISIGERLAKLCECGVLMKGSDNEYYNVGQSYINLFSCPPKPINN